MLEDVAAAFFYGNGSSLGGFQFTPVPESSRRTTANTGTTVMFGFTWCMYSLGSLRDVLKQV